MRFNLIISNPLEEKIRFLCQEFKSTEWSGILFYKQKGSLEDGTFEVECVDLCLMDIGKYAFTEFDDSPEILSYRLDHDLLNEDIQEGLIHSHHTMETFFSGTDMSTLSREGENCNHFLSLIVNNDGNYNARITRKIKTEKRLFTTIKSVKSCSYNTFNNILIPLCKDKKDTFHTTSKENEEEVEWFEANVRKPNIVHVPIFIELVNKIKELKETKETTVSHEAIELDGKSFIDWDKVFNNSSKQMLGMDNVLLQILFGPFVNTSNTNKTNLLPRLDNLYIKQFGENFENNPMSRNWVMTMIDLLAENLLYTGIEGGQFILYLQKEAHKLPKSKVKEFLMSIIKEEYTWYI